MQHKIEVDHSRQLEQTAEIDNLEQLLVRHFRQLFEMGVEVFCVPARQVLRILDGLGTRSGAEIELACRNSFHKAHLGGHNMPGQFQSASRVCVRPVVAFVWWNRFDNAFGGSMLVLEIGEKKIVEQEIRLVGLEFAHVSRISRREIKLEWVGALLDFALLDLSPEIKRESRNASLRLAQNSGRAAL